MKKLLSNIDELDKLILQELMNNARISLVDISKKVGISRVAVRARLLELEESGLIDKYTIILNPDKVGHSISVYFDIQVSVEKLTEACEILANEDSIYKLYQMTGNGNLHVHAMFANNKELEKVLKDVIYKLPGLGQVTCNTIIATIKDDTSLKVL